MNPKIKEALVECREWVANNAVGVGILSIAERLDAALALCDEPDIVDELIAIDEASINKSINVDAIRQIIARERGWPPQKNAEAVMPPEIVAHYEQVAKDEYPQPAVSMAMLEHVWNGGYLSPDAEIKGEASLQQRKIDIDEIAARYGYKVIGD